VRVPDPKNASSTRDVEQICDEELQAGLRLLLSQGGAMDAEAMLAQTARLFGFSKLGDHIRQRIETCISALQKQGDCVPRGGALTVQG
jgi:hypothetical protein